MNVALDTVVADRLHAARGDPRAAEDLIAALVAGLGLAIAFAADGDTSAASNMCEGATAVLFETVTANADEMRGYMGGVA